MTEHTCIKDDGGTPNRRCHACEAERMTDEQLIAVYFSRGVVEAERFLARDIYLTAPGSETRISMRPIFKEWLDRTLDAAAKMGVTIDRSLAVGEWAPRV